MTRLPTLPAAVGPRVVTALVVTTALGLSACGGGEDDSEDDSGGSVVLHIQHSGVPSEPFADPLEAAFRQFEQENPDIKIDEKVVDVEDSPQVYETSLTAGEPPEIVMINLFGKPITWTENEATLPVTDYLDEWGLADMLKDEAVEEWTTEDGDVQAFPYFGFAWPVWYNTDLLNKAGVDAVPQTTDELLDATQKLERAGIGGIAVGGRDWSGNKLFWQTIQAYITDEEMKDLYVNGGWGENADVLKGVDLFVQLRDAGVFIDSVEGLTVDASYGAFNKQQAAIMPAGSWAFDATPDDVAKSVELSGLPMPEDSVHALPLAYTGYTSLGFWLSPTAADEIDAVEKFMKFMYQPDSYAPFIEDAGYLPPMEDVEFDASKVSPLLADVLQGDYEKRVEFAVLPDIFVPPDVLSATERTTSLAFTSGTSPEEIIDGLDAAYK